MHDSTIHVGVAQLTLHFPGARSLKDRRRDLVGLRDRVLHRFSVSWNQVDQEDDPRIARVVVTTSGNDARKVRSALDQVVNHVQSSGRAVLGTVDVDVSPWHPDQQFGAFDEGDFDG